MIEHAQRQNQFMVLDRCMLRFLLQARWVHSPLTTCTHDRSKNHGKGVIFITCLRKFSVREIFKKGCFGAQCPQNKKIGYFFQNPQWFTPLKIQYFLADFSRFPSVFHQIWLFFVRKIQVRKISTFVKRCSCSRRNFHTLGSMGYPDNGYQQFVTRNTSLAD